MIFRPLHSTWMKQVFPLALILIPPLPWVTVESQTEISEQDSFLPWLGFPHRNFISIFLFLFWRPLLFCSSLCSHRTRTIIIIIIIIIVIKFPSQWWEFPLEIIFHLCSSFSVSKTCLHHTVWIHWTIFNLLYSTPWWHFTSLRPSPTLLYIM